MPAMFRRGRRSWRFWLPLMALAVVQAWFVHGLTRQMRPGIEEMPPPPTLMALKAMALGDEEFMFRYMGRWLQGVGDGGGRVRPLRVYDYDRVVNWLKALDAFDAERSDYVHALAAKYFGQVNIDPDRVRKIADYLRAVGEKDPAHRWQWLVWCGRAAHFPLKDPALTKAIAHDLQSPELNRPDIPAWVRVLPVRLYHQVGDEEDARAAAATISPEDIIEFNRERHALDEAIRRGGPSASAEDNGAPK